MHSFRGAATTPQSLPQVLPISDEALTLASALLHRDEVVAFPTETVYGLGASALSAAAVERIYLLKGRPRYNPLIVHVPDCEAARRWALDWPPVAELLAEHFWPGPLTLVVRRGAAIPALVSAGLPTVALRVPAHPAALRLLRACGLPLAAPSANRSEQLSPTLATHVARSLPGVPLILDGGPCQLGIESTVVDLTTTPPRLLRPGALPLRRLRELLPELELPSLEPASEGSAARPSPGMMARHYAPRARLVLLPSDSVEALLALPAPRGLLCCDAQPQLAAHCAAVEQLPADAPGFAADLYAALHRLDDSAAGLKTIAVAPLPLDSDDFYAIRDRLGRAATSAPPDRSRSQ